MPRSRSKATVRCSCRFLCNFTVMLLALPCAGFCQVAAGDVAPDRVTLGDVHVGSIVEASFRVFADGDDIADLKPFVVASDWMKVKDVSVKTQEYGRFGTKTVCDVSLSIDTGKAAELSGTVRVDVRDLRVNVAVQANVLPKDAAYTRALIVESPINKFSTDDASHFDAWLGIVKDAKLDVDYWLVTRGDPVLRGKDLKNFDVILVGCLGIQGLQEADVRALKDFIEKGGRVIVAANYFFRGTVPKANEVIESYGLRMQDEEDNGATALNAIDAEQIFNDNLTAGVKHLVFFRPSPIQVTDAKKGKLLVGSPKGAGKGFVAVARAGKGEVIAYGLSLWWNSLGRPEEMESDNVRLLQNLLTRPRAGR